MQSSSVATYASAYAAVGLLWLLAPPAAILMAAVVTANLADEWLASKPDPAPVPVEAPELYEGNWYTCSCHERMGNDFYFLPINCCLKGKCDGPSRN